MDIEMYGGNYVDIVSYGIGGICAILGFVGIILLIVGQVKKNEDLKKKGGYLLIPLGIILFVILAVVTYKNPDALFTILRIFLR